MTRPTAHSIAADLDARIYRRFRSALLDRQRTQTVILALIRAENAWAPAGLATMIADRNRRRAWARANATLGTTWIAAKLLSRATKRPRPYFTDCPPARRKTDRESFPSTHAAVSFAAAVTVPPLLPPTPLFTLAIATTLSRLLLGEHYPSDVAAGAILGIAITTPMRLAADPPQRSLACRRLRPRRDTQTNRPGTIG
jgi:undecaprenyl-diphosphatase